MIGISIIVTSRCSTVAIIILGRFMLTLASETPKDHPNHDPKGQKKQISSIRWPPQRGEDFDRKHEHRKHRDLYLLRKSRRTSTSWFLGNSWSIRWGPCDDLRSFTDGSQKVRHQKSQWSTRGEDFVQSNISNYSWLTDTSVARIILLFNPKWMWRSNSVFQDLRLWFGDQWWLLGSLFH